MDTPAFPDFKRLTLEDRPVLHPRLWAYQPETSELTFTNLYLWRSYYQYEWCLLEGCLILLAHAPDRHAFVLPPVCEATNADVVYRVLSWMRDALGIERPRVERADDRLAEALKDDARFHVLETRDHFDYVYRTEDLARLAGRRYSAKRNHINQFRRYYQHEYRPVTPDLVGECIALAEVWCEQRLCEEDLSLQHEFGGIKAALENLEALEFDGGAILVEGKVQAFALGEILNRDTAVIHIEKANPDFKGIYPRMTQAYAERWLGEVSFLNLEQDLGEPGLRRAKQSYHPDHLVPKYEISLSE